MLAWLKSLFSGSGRNRIDGEISRLRSELAIAQRRIGQIRGSYDAAVNNDETTSLWSRADNLSAKLANSLPVRKQLRERSRHEAGNGSHMRGITLALANDLIGTGPSLQILLDDEQVCDGIERAWEQWAGEIELMAKAHTYVLATIVDGEGVAKLVTNPTLYDSVKLDVQLIECDLLSSPYQKPMDMAVDGIEFDEFGNPSAYHILKVHPSEAWYLNANEYETVKAANLLHFFRMDRPGQARGIPELTPALLIFGHLREYDSAVLTAARVAACLSALIHTKASADVSSTVAPFTATDMEPGMIVAMPDGYDVTQLRSEQPTSTYDTFTQRKLAQACHCCNIPYAIATGDFSRESYAGGRMARQVYHASVAVRRAHLNARFFDRIFRAWYDEAILVPGYLPAGAPANSRDIPKSWFYPPWESIDETKAAAAITTNLANATTTLAEECAKKGQDWRKVIRQRGIEIEMLKEVGAFIAPPGSPPTDGGDGTSDTQDSNTGADNADTEAA